jgi:hypothetical protein
VQGAEQVNSANAKAAKLFKPDGTNAFEIMHTAADGNLAYWVGIQRTVVRMQGQETPRRSHRWGSLVDGHRSDRV